MKILVVGGGGREHAICWKLSHEKDVEKIYCAPGSVRRKQGIFERFHDKTWFTNS